MRFSEAFAFETDGFNYLIDGDYVSLTGTTLTDEKIEIPAFVEYEGVKYPVKRIAENAFKDNVVLKGLTIPNGITSIGANAFNGCSNLEKVTLLSEVAPVLGEGAFDEATYTKVELRVPDASKEKYTNNEAWNKFISILGLSEPISVKLDGFENLQVLINENEASEESGKAREFAGQSVTLVSVSPDESGKLIIPSDVVIDGVTYQVSAISEGAFKDNSSVKEIFIPESVEKIGSEAFKGNTSLTAVTIPASVKEIGSGAFAECDNIEKIISEPTVPPTLGEGAFSEKTLKNAEVRVNDESADAYRASEDWSKFGTLLGKSEAYSVETEGNGSLRAEIREGEPGDNGEAAPRFVVIVSGAPDEDGKVIIPSEVEICGVSYPVKEIGEGAFKDNSSLKEIVIPESVEKIGSEAFKGNTSLTEVTIPASVKEIGSGAFADCDNISKIISEPTVPPTLGEGAFSENTLRNAEVRVNDESAEAYRASEDWSKFGTLLGKSEAYSVESEGKGSLRAEIREGEPGDNGEAAPRFVVIVSGAPDEDGKVIIPSEVEICGVSYPVKEIGEGAFKDNSSLKEIVIPESVEKIGSEAFKGNTSLTEVTIPASVKEIGSGAFAECDNIEKIISEPTVPPTLGEGAFSEKTLKNAEVRVNDESKQSYATSNGWNNFKTILGMSEVRVEGISLSAAEITLKINDTFTLETIISPETATNKELEWHSSNEEVATATQEGVITAIAPGTATISVNTVDGSALKAECVVTVIENQVEDNGDNKDDNPEESGDNGDENRDDNNENGEISGDISGTGEDVDNPDSPGEESNDPNDEDNNGIDTQNLDGESDDTSGVDSQASDGKLHCSKVGDDLIIEGVSSDTIIEIYSMKGQLMYRGTEKRIEGLTPGIYIVRSNKQTIKFAK